MPGSDMTTRAAPLPHLTSIDESRAVASRVATLTEGEIWQVLHYLAGLSPQAVDTAITAVKAPQLCQEVE